MASGPSPGTTPFTEKLPELGELCGSIRQRYGFDGHEDGGTSFSRVLRVVSATCWSSRLPGVRFRKDALNIPEQER